jgi:hypothetical protein
MNSKLIDHLRRRWGNPAREFLVTAIADIETLAKEAKGPLATIFFSGRCRRVHKWTHYFPVYERYFSRFRGEKLRFLEIGVFGGGSLDMWREYFGADAIIYGIDINPECAGLARSPSQVRIGSQDDPAFLRSVVAEMGGIDVVLDDGSHVGKHQQASFEVLFPLLNEGGIYMIEDTCTSYWGEFGGGYRRPGTAIEFGKRILDDMHAWYHGRSPRTNARDQVSATHFHDGIIVVEKGTRSRPVHVIIEPSAREGHHAG